MRLQVRDIKDGEPIVLVCALATMAPIFTDNVRGRCYKCAREVQHRPHVPPSAQCICVDCYVAARKPDDVELVTPTTVLEILATRSDDES